MSSFKFIAIADIWIVELDESKLDSHCSVDQGFAF